MSSNRPSIALAGEPAGVPASADLCVRAATLLRETTNSQAGVTIYNDKRLPLGGGLGGGSSDAATTLLVLNRLWELDLPRDELARLGLSLGADVPVFVHGHAAWAEGIGERLTPVTPPETWYSSAGSAGKHINCRNFFRSGFDTGHAPNENTRPSFGRGP